MNTKKERHFFHVHRGQSNNRTDRVEPDFPRRVLNSHGVAHSIDCRLRRTIPSQLWPWANGTGRSDINEDSILTFLKKMWYQNCCRVKDGFDVHVECKIKFLLRDCMCWLFVVTHY